MSGFRIFEAAADPMRLLPFQRTSSGSGDFRPLIASASRATFAYLLIELEGEQTSPRPVMLRPRDRRGFEVEHVQLLGQKQLDDRHAAEHGLQHWAIAMVARSECARMIETPLVEAVETEKGAIPKPSIRNPAEPEHRPPANPFRLNFNPSQARKSMVVGDAQVK